MYRHQYQIGEKVYIQKPLVLGQIKQFLTILQGIQLPATMDVMGIITALGDNLPKALAIVLIEAPGDVPLKDRDITTIAAEIEYLVDLETAVKVAEDFFVCNPIASLYERISGMAKQIIPDKTPAG
jgi:hypothetical protein